MRIQKEGIVGLIVVRHSVEKWLNGEQIGCITLNQHTLRMEDVITNCDMYILGEYDVHSVVTGKILSDGKYKDITFSEAYDMLSENMMCSHTDIVMLPCTIQPILNYICVG